MTAITQSCLWQGRRFLLALAIITLPLAGSGQTESPEAGMWIPFAAHWSATGQRQALRIGSKEAVTVHLSGAFVVTAGEGLSKGFRAEALGFDDGGGTSTAKMVLTDEKNDQIFCDVKGRSIETGQLFLSTITGGTGRFQGLRGEFSFHWQFVVLSPDGTFQGRAVDLKGRYRRPPASEAGR